MRNEELVIVGGGGIGRGLATIHGDATLWSRGTMTATEDLAEFLGELPHGRPVYLIDAAGVSVDGLLEDVSDNDIDIMINANVTGIINMAKIFAEHTVERPGSSLLFLGTVVSRLGVKGAATYGATKAVTNGLVRGLCREFAPNDCRVNVIEMGYFDAGMMNRLESHVQERIVAGIPLRRKGTVEELDAICMAVLDNAYMTGAVVSLTGGL